MSEERSSEKDSCSCLSHADGTAGRERESRLMGERANLVVVQSSQWELYYSHWCAGSLACDLFWGPVHAERFIRIQRPSAPDEWLDTVWAEGGAVLDLDRRSLLFFGGGDFLYDVPLRRMLLRLMKPLWEGWTIQWAYEGIVAIAEAVGVSRSTVIAARNSSEEPPPSWETPEERSWVQTIGCIERDGELRIYPLGLLAEDYLTSGPRLLSSPGVETGFPALRLRDWTSDFPSGGFSIDVSAQTLDFWTAAPNLLAEIQAAWDGWTVVWNQDLYETQLARCRGKLQLEGPPRAEIIGNLRRRLSHDPRPVNLADLVQRIAPMDQTVQINAYALRDDRLPVAESDRLSLFDWAVARLEAEESEK